jgi:hypothetical protein
MLPMDRDLLVAKVKAVARGPQAQMLNHLLYILGQPLENCPVGFSDGPLKVLREVLATIYEDFKDLMVKGGGCPYALTCRLAASYGCGPRTASKAAVLAFRYKSHPHR